MIQKEKLEIKEMSFKTKYQKSHKRKVMCANTEELEVKNYSTANKSTQKLCRVIKAEFDISLGFDI